MSPCIITVFFLVMGTFKIYSHNFQLCNTISLPVAAMLYFTSLWLIYFMNSRSCIGEGNGNPLQCSCLENPRDGGAWWAALYGVAQSRTRLKRLSSSSSSSSSSDRETCLVFDLNADYTYVFSFWKLIKIYPMIDVLFYMYIILLQ